MLASGRLLPQSVSGGQSFPVVDLLLVFGAWMVGYSLLRVGDFGGVSPGAYVVGFLAATMLLTVIHEFGHAAVARLTGTAIFGVRVGSGVKLLTVSIGRIWVDLRLPFIGGATYLGESPTRVRALFVFVAGVSAEAATMAVAFLWRPEADFAKSLRGGVLAMGVVDIVMNLWPRPFPDRRYGRFRTDGGQIVDLLRGKPEVEVPLDAEVVRKDIAVARLAEEGRFAEAVRVALEEVRHDPSDTHAQRRYGNALVLSGRWREGFDVLAPTVCTTTISHIADAVAANNAAFAAVMTFDDELQEQALRLSSVALAFEPEHTQFQSTRGAALAMNGAPDEGLDLLRRVFPDPSSNASDRAISTGFAALVALQNDDIETGRTRFRAMYALDSKCPLADRIARILGPHEVSYLARLIAVWATLPSERAAPDTALGLTARVALAHVNGAFCSDPLDDEHVVLTGNPRITAGDIRRLARSLLAEPD